jgi:iron complex outermembrane recepter protein
MKLRYSALYVAMTAIFASGAVYAAAQDPAPKDTAASRKVKDLDSVQVTATKRETAPTRSTRSG